ncbi:MAG: hypothetical protein QOC96_2801 [Acidobacteriota bacterium]|jgi:hypothetical protein|nr:hypothetical protein [Acidobacteriota bacterium]
MGERRYNLLLKLGLIIILPLTIAKFDANAQAAKPDKLYLVRKIYIGDIEDQIDKEKRIVLFLKQELEARGFIIVNDSASADAILSGWISNELPLDGGDSSWLKSYFEFHLESQSKEKVWERTIKIHNKTDVVKSAKTGARKLAEKLEDDWKQSAKKAAMNK